MNISSQAEVTSRRTHQVLLQMRYNETALSGVLLY